METPKESSQLEEKKTLREKVQDSIVIKTELDAYIGELVKGQPQSADEIKVKDVKFDVNKHRLSLPDSIEKKYSKKYAFRWVNKKKDWIDRAIHIRHWLIVNRVLFADLPRHIFTANGTVENGDAILCFMPIEQAESLRREPQRISSERVKDLPMEKWKNAGEDSPFYKPTLGQEEKDGEVQTVGVQPDVQP